MDLQQLNTYLLGNRNRGFMGLRMNESEIQFCCGISIHLPVNFEEKRR